MRRYVKYGIGCVLALSLAFNVVTIYWDIYPFIAKRLFKVQEGALTPGQGTVSTVTDASLKMVNSPRVTMVWDEPTGVVENLKILVMPRQQKEFYLYSYPRAYLYYGIGQAVLANPTKVENRDAFLAALEKIIDADGKPLFEIKRIDQTPFALAALCAYRINGDSSYLEFAKRIYNYLQGIAEEDGILLYRPKQTVLMTDALGMAVPFLVEYYEVTGDETALQMARRQLEYYIRNGGIDKDSGVPAHAVQMETGVKVGSANWGRGIGWYYIALAHFYRQTGEFEQEYERLTQTLLKLRNDKGQWTQYLGADRNFDASSSTMFFYGMLLNNAGGMSIDQAVQALAPYISAEGEILQTSGDTYDLNNYSQTFGKSELSQGMLMLILAQKNNPQMK